MKNLDFGNCEPIQTTVNELITMIKLFTNLGVIDRARVITFAENLSSARDEVEQQLLDNYRKLNEDGRKKLLDYAIDLVMSGRYKPIDFRFYR